MLTLRPYQADAVQAMLNATGSGLISLPTGSGKSLVVADFAHKLGQPALVLQPSREILFQNREKLLGYVEASEVGTYSASFNLKEIRRFTFATIQSVYKKPELFAHFNVVIIDEVHLLNAKNAKGMFTTFLKNIGKCRIFGLTATPYRIEIDKIRDFRKRETTMISKIKMMSPSPFKETLYVASTKELTRQGFLAPLVYNTDIELPVSFSVSSDKKLVDMFVLQLSFGDDKIKKVLSVIPKFKSVVVFCPSVDLATRFSRICTEVTTAVVDGHTPDKERDQILADFKSGKVKAVFNCGVLTTGFDHPGIDCIILLRPTKSLTLYNQMIGRGTRNAPGKKNCTVYDLTGTVNHLGKLEDIEVLKDDFGNWNVKTKAGWMKDKIVSFYKRSF